MKSRKHSKSHGGGLFSPSVNEYGATEPSWWDKMKNKFSSAYQSTVPDMSGGKSSRKGGRKSRGGKSRGGRKSRGGKHTRKHRKH